MVIELGLVVELKMDYRRYSTSDREIVVSADKSININRKSKT
jgi:hypothetical protein